MNKTKPNNWSPTQEDDDVIAHHAWNTTRKTKENTAMMDIKGVMRIYNVEQAIKFASNYCTATSSQFLKPECVEGLCLAP